MTADAIHTEPNGDAARKGGAQEPTGPASSSKSRSAARRDTDPTRLASIRPSLPRELVERLTNAIVTGATPPTVTTYAPFTGEAVVDLPQSMPGDVRLAFDRARAAREAWAVRPLRERVAVLRRMHGLLLDRRNQLMDLIQIETGKSRLHAFDEILDAVTVARHYTRAAHGYLRPRRRTGALPVLTRTLETRVAKGAVGVITPWNYPLALAADDILPALVAGNAVVHKPDTQTALTSLRLRELAVQAGLPADVWQVVIGDGPVVGPAVVDNADYVAFTGSTRTGRQVAQQAAMRLIGCSLELGGKNAMIVLDDANLDDAVAGAVRGCYASAGQLCVSIERLYVHYSLIDDFTQRFLTEVKALRLGSGLDYSADMGSLASTKQLETVTMHVEDAKAKGAKVLAGGRRRPDIGPLFYEPTVLGNVRQAMTVFGEETFGPVVSVYEFRNESDVLAAANDTPYGLNASVWTRDGKRAKEMAHRLRAGSVNVNEAYAATYGTAGAPMGGMGQSGIGRRHGADGILRYTDAQTIAYQRMLPVAPWFGMSDERWTGLVSRLLKLLMRLHVK
jgi:succinate-semialdehyde dehydrogenase/glutarate-semialdehyde dehydrogenase